ncbi:MAG TPA: JAB domain-containing protein [Crenotrichaceae bacterium]|nr:JAB domain-containing protein [Crenotrichaceae bacterium]
MAITDWPVNERPREKLMKHGSQSLSDAELLAIFLRTGIQGVTAVDLARQLLDQFGSLKALLEADRKVFCNSPGLGPAKYALLQSVLEMANRYIMEDLEQNSALTSVKKTRAYLTQKLRGYGHEVFSCLFLDNRHRVIVFEELFHGTLDNAIVYPRQVAKRALKHNAAALILAHNHPSGETSPSEQDKQLTNRLKQSLGLFDITVLDHFIVGDGQAYSFAEHGLI